VENCALVSAEFTEPTIDIHYRDLMSVIKGSMADPAEEARHLALGEGFMKPDDVPQLLTVPAKTLSRVLDEQGIGPVDLLSLDVEGYEVQVLNGMDWRRHRPAFLLLEVRDQPGIEAVIAPWYRRAAVLNETEDYADILYARKD